MIYELRLYSVAPGRMADVHDRFARHLPTLFQRHGVNLVGRWSALAGPDAPRFVYLIAYRDYAQREAVWSGFYQDADWWRIRAETNAGHEMVERHDLFFLKPNAAWAAAADPQVAVGGVHELVQQEIAPGQNARANAFLKDVYLPLVREAGGQVLGVFDMAAGAGMQKVVQFIAWPDAVAWHAGRSQVEAHDGLRAALKAQRESAEGPIFERAEVNLLAPGPSAEIRAGFGRLAN